MSKNKETEKKPGFFSRWRKSLRVSFAELKKVHWPTRPETVTYTGVVLFTVAVVTVFIWAIDYGVTALFSLFV